MKIVGYADRLSVQPGQRIAFMISSESEHYTAGLVRLIHGDDSPAGPGFKSEDLESEIAGDHPGHRQPLRPGSLLRIPLDAAAALDSLTVHLWVWPTTPGKPVQTLLSGRSGDGATGFALRLVSGRPTLIIGGSELALDEPLPARTWTAVTAAFDATRGEARLTTEPLDSAFGGPPAMIIGPLSGSARCSEVLIGAERLGPPSGQVGHHYNGKIDSPRLFRRSLDHESRLRPGTASTDPDHPDLVAHWDFAADISTRTITDRSGHGRHGHTVNQPMRGATGWNWDGSETAWPHAVEQYGAIHFHDDDLADAGWQQSLAWTVPDDLPSGVYALRLSTAEGDEDHIPFAVRPRRGRPTARIAFLMPTFSYLAYANHHAIERLVEDPADPPEEVLRFRSTPEGRYILDNRLNSLYDLHTDGSGVCYASRLRPLVDLRPKYQWPGLNDGAGAPHQFNADLFIVDWLDHHGYPVDVITDDDLHAEGAELLSPYRVVITGSHHEYWSGRMITAGQSYLRSGGRLMYLSGNGMYWVTGVDPETGTMIEIRRVGPSTRKWEPEPGEAHLSSTGELGGLWRFRGRSPQSWLGVGFTAQGVGPGRPYRRLPDSHDPRVAWAFDGIGADELIGDFPCLVNGYGAAGYEIDRLDPALGSPPGTLLLATASGFSDSYQHASEEVLRSDSRQGGTVNPLVRADLTLLEYRGGGAVFATGSINWTGCLSHNGYANSVSRLTRNLLDRFASDAAGVLD